VRKTEVVSATRMSEQAKGGRTETAVVETLEMVRVRRGARGQSRGR